MCFSQFVFPGVFFNESIFMTACSPDPPPCLEDPIPFDALAWRAAYPQFSALTEAQAAGYFELACLILTNAPGSCVRDLNRRRVLLWLLTAHYAQLALNGGGLVGRVSKATRGSVSVETDGAGVPKGAWWFSQTPYGASFWQATLSLRQMRFLPGQTHPARIFP